MWGKLSEKDYKRQEKLLQVVDMFIILIMVMVPWLYTYVKTSDIIHSKRVQFTVCQLSLNKTVFKKLKDKTKQTNKRTGLNLAFVEFLTWARHYSGE